MKIGIMGVGRISEQVVPTICAMDEAELYAVASRSLEKAQSFASRHGAKVAYGSYEELVADPEIELIYVATPHSHHYEHAKLCLIHNKPALVEKAFTVNATQAKELAALAKNRSVYLAEANWTRYMPSRKIIEDIIQSGIIGDVSVLSGSLCYYADGKERIFDPFLAGGALLDVGIYCVDMALMHFGKNFDRIDTSVKKMPNGLDSAESITIHYPDSKMACFTCSVLGRSDKSAVFHGTKGYLYLQNIPNPRNIQAFDLQDNLILEQQLPSQITGYEYEFQEAIACIKEGRYESKSMPLSESIYLMETLDSIRAQWNLRFPME